ncbi:MAG: hypothetical protein AB7U20_24825 [Planctomycetaceae bacterium]
MNHFTSKPTLAAIAFSAALVCSTSDARAEIRRGILYDLLHPGQVCGPSCSDSSCPGVSGWVEDQLEVEKMRIRESLRIHRMEFYLHNQDHKKLLHPECSPFQDCYWGVYPTCWRQFPGRPHCPGPVSDPTYYDSDYYGPDPGGISPGIPDGAAGPAVPAPEALEFAPPGPESARPAPAAAPYFE